MKHFLFTAGFFCCCFLACIQVYAQYAYVTNSDTGSKSTVTVVNTLVNTAVSSIPLPYDGADAVVVSRDGSKAYITYYNNNHIITIINTATNSVSGNIFLGNGGFGADGIDISPDGTKLYYSGLGSITDTVFVVNSLLGNVEAKIVLPSGAEGIAVSPDGTKVFVADAGKLAVINTATNSVTGFISTAATGFYGIAVSPDGSRVYAGDLPGKKVYVFNANTNALLTTVQTTAAAASYLLGLAVSPDGSRIYIADLGTHKISVIDATTNSLIDSIPVGIGSYGLSLTPDGTRLYVTAKINGIGMLTGISTATNSIIANIPAGSNPIAFGKFISGPAIPGITGAYTVSGSSAPVISDTFFSPLKNAAGQLYAEINAGGNYLGQVNWGANIYAGTDIRNTYWWFRRAFKEYGAFLKRNIYVNPANQPNLQNRVRIYCTNNEIQNFINNFNSQYSTTLTINDIRIIKYNGANVDFNWLNNDDNSGEYASITPSVIGYYGFTNEYRFFEFPVSSYSEFWIGLTIPQGVLPLKLDAFNGINAGGRGLLSWQTVSEQNVARFEVERSPDGINFLSNGIIPALGNSAGIRNYSFTDEKPFSPQSYYRLKLIDRDDQFTYSKIVTIDFARALDFIIYPNPAKSNLSIQSRHGFENGDCLSLLDLNGRVVRKLVLKANPGSTLHLYIGDLAPGNYEVSFRGVVRQFIKR